MSATQLFLICFCASLAVVVLFNVLYFFVVLIKLGDKEKLGSDAIWNFGQGKYVALYLSTLTTLEKRKWYNWFLKNFMFFLGGLWLVGLAALVVSWQAR